MLNFNYVYKFLQKVLRLQEVITCYKIIGELQKIKITFVVVVITTSLSFIINNLKTY